MNRWDGKKTNWKPLVSHRCIVVEDKYLGSSYEILVLEVSPSDKYVKFRYPSGHEGWEGYDEYLLVEDLGMTEIKGGQYGS